MVKTKTLGIWAAAIFASFATGALAQQAPPAVQQKPSCAEGTTSTGECVNPRLGNRLRMRAIIRSQPKFSYSVQPFLPEDDYNPAIPGLQIREIDRMYRLNQDGF